MRRNIVRFLLVVQSILFLGHWVVYESWEFFHPHAAHRGIPALAAAMAILSLTFLAASVLARKYSNVFARAFYKGAAVWLGFLSFFFLAAVATWIFYGMVQLAGLRWQRQNVADVLFGLAALAGIYGLLNASQLRVKKITVKLPNLPPSWNGRVAALVTDMHLGHVRGYRFTKRIVEILSQLRPDIVLIGGDMYDGTSGNARRMAQPWKAVAAPFGSYFIEGNHEEFGGRESRFTDALKDSGVRVLDGEKVEVDGLQLVGVNYRDTVNAERLRSILRSADLDPSRASILLSHAPHHLPIVEEEKIGLQLSGHTHAGQFFPFTWITSRIWGPFVYGLKRLGSLMVYTSCGVGTWGPPMRVGTSPEIVLIGFE